MGVEMCANIAKFKQDLLTGKDKWADKEQSNEDQVEESKEKVEVKKADLKVVVKDLQNVMV
jgi:hypothetical protein